MQVLKESKVKFVSAVFSQLQVLSYSSRKKKNPPADFEPANPVLQVFPDPAGKGGLGSFPVVP